MINLNRKTESKPTATTTSSMWLLIVWRLKIYNNTEYNQPWRSRPTQADRNVNRQNRILNIFIADNWAQSGRWFCHQMGRHLGAKPRCSLRACVYDDCAFQYATTHKRPTPTCRQSLERRSKRALTRPNEHCRCCYWLLFSLLFISWKSTHPPTSWHRLQAS